MVLRGYGESLLIDRSRRSEWWAGRSPGEAKVANHPFSHREMDVLYARYARFGEEEAGVERVLGSQSRARVMAVDGWAVPMKACCSTAVVKDQCRSTAVLDATVVDDLMADGASRRRVSEVPVQTGTVA